MFGQRTCEDTWWGVFTTCYLYKSPRWTFESWVGHVHDVTTCHEVMCCWPSLCEMSRKEGGAQKNLNVVASITCRFPRSLLVCMVDANSPANTKWRKSDQTSKNANQKWRSKAKVVLQHNFESKSSSFSVCVALFTFSLLLSNHKELFANRLGITLVICNC